MIPFNKPYSTGDEIRRIREALQSGRLSGDGIFTSKCHRWLEEHTGCRKALLTHSCTAALEMSAILADIGEGDEVIMPSFTFVSTANAFVLRGATPVFVDIRPDTLNLDESLISSALTERTRAIVPVHYAGVGCEMRTISAIAKERDLLVIEDAAQGVQSEYCGKPLGSIGNLATLSFHETKNITSGEGGALLINDERFCDRAEVIRDKGTNRSSFLRREVDRYSWTDIGSSYLLGELAAAYLSAQMAHASSITQRRLALWRRYHEAFADLEEEGLVRRPIVPTTCRHNAHMYYLLLEDLSTRDSFIRSLEAQGIQTLFHYVPLHSSPGGRKYGRTPGDLGITTDTSQRLVRLPLWLGLEEQQQYVIDRVRATLVVAAKD